MEKYSRFRDEATGIAPFQEARPAPASAVQTGALYVLGAVAYPFCVVNLAIYFLVAKPLLPAALSRAVLNWLVLVPLRVLYVFLTYEGEHRASVRQKLIRRAAPGDVLLSNFTSPLDPLVYESRQRTWFVLPEGDRFAVVSTFGAMKRALSAQAPRAAAAAAPRASLSEITQAAAKSGAVVVLFVEGTPTNGRGLLTLKDLNVREIAEIETEVYAAALRYTPATATAPVPETLLGFLWRLGHSSASYVASARVSGQPIPKSALQRAEISKAIGAIGRLRILGDRLDRSAKEEYAALRKK